MKLTLKQVETLPGSNDKLSKLISLGLKAFPNGSTQIHIREEIKRLYDAGYQVEIPKKYQTT